MIYLIIIDHYHVFETKAVMTSKPHFLNPMFTLYSSAAEKNDEQNRLLLESNSIINIRAISNDYFLNALSNVTLEQFYILFHSFVNRMARYAMHCVSTSDIYTLERGAEMQITVYNNLDSLEKRIYEDFVFNLNQFYKIEFGSLNPHTGSYCGYPDVHFFNGWRPHTNFLRKPSQPLFNKRKRSA
eukprot:NODE_774_length_4360_cov_0.289134.p3 type:complete len:185 gc:universal NODE_774_length_4360_cov_0.289134:4298-3744(-)